MHVLITGSSGFIGFHLARRLLREGHKVTGIDGMTHYYDVRLKQARLAQLAANPDFVSHELMLEDHQHLAEVIKQANQRAPIDFVIHLAAQAGVRYSLENPRAYVESNFVGTFNLIEQIRHYDIAHFLFASTSSVYGANTKVPAEETDAADHPLTLYAATKKSTEVMVHAHAHLWKIPSTAFRFFTVYGPWGRPDMAFFKFTKAILADQPIDIYNHGQMTRDFTYIDDLIEAIMRLTAHPPHPDERKGARDSLSPVAPFRIVNIGGGTPVALLDFIAEIEKAIGKKAIRNYLPMQSGDVFNTCASPALLQQLTDYCPQTPIEKGIPAFVQWYRDYTKACE